MAPLWIDAFPELRSEWCADNDVIPADVSRGSNHVVKWRCATCAEEWDATVKSRTVMHSGCPYCSGRRARPGVTDLATLYPDTAALWSPLNAGSPTATTANSHRKVLWVCPEGHEWSAAPANQVRSKGCAECRKYTATPGVDDVRTVAPHVADEWAPSNPVPPERHKVNGAVVRWVCRTCAYTWKERVDSRVRNPSCAACSFRKLVEGTNDLAATDPAISEQWAASNEALPSRVMRRSAARVLWVCPHMHTYTLSVRTKVKRGEGYCPECVKLSKPPKPAREPKPPKPAREPKPPKPSLFVTHPELSAQWHSDNAREPSTVTAGSAYRALWNTPCGHVVSVPVRERVAKPANCPVCSGKQVQAGVNDLATLRPDLAAQWHPDNTKLASEVTRGSGYAARWVCAVDPSHEWKTPVTNRATRGSGCPLCSNNEIRQGVNDLATTHPALARQWHPSNAHAPTSVSAGSNTPVKWVCDGGHTWVSPPLARTYRGEGCPVCSGRTAHAGYNDLATHYPALVREWHPTKNAKPPSEFTHGSRQKVWWLGECGHEWEATILNRRNGSGCNRCSNKVSSMERDLREAVNEWVHPVTLVASDKSVLGGNREVDIHIPSLGVAIEFNGVYWHSTANGKPPTFHVDKTRDCAQKGVRLLHVWEDHWVSSRQAVEHSLKFELGVLTDPDTWVVESGHDDVARAFLEENHIHGAVSGHLHAAAFEVGSTRPFAVVAYRAHGGEVTVERFATTKNVSARLLNDLLRAAAYTSCVAMKAHTSTGVLGVSAPPHPPVRTDARGYVCTCGSHRRMSMLVANGSRLAKMLPDVGFAEVVATPPAFTYLYKGSRVLPGAITPSTFKRDPKLVYRDGLSVASLAELNGVPRVYDEGGVKFSRDMTPPSPR